MAEILLGTQGWSYSDWVGPFYPPTSRQSDFLGLYSQTFQTVEIDSTFYAAPRATVVDSWRRNTPSGFQFAAKLPQNITHEKRLVGTERELGDFLALMARLDDRLGPILAQCPPAFQSHRDRVGGRHPQIRRSNPGAVSSSLSVRDRGVRRA